MLESLDDATTAQEGLEKVSGVVEWFKYKEGRGYIMLSDGRTAKLRVTGLLRRNCWSVSTGTKVTCLVIKADDGSLIVDDVLSLDWSALPKDDLAAVEDRALPQVAATGVMKFFDHKKGFGFAVQDESGAPNIFVHTSMCKRNGFDSTLLNEGVRVELMYVDKGPKGLKAVDIKLGQ